MEFRPCIDIHNGKVKQIVGGSLRDEADRARENFVAGEDAAYYARLYREAGLKGGHIILLNGRDSTYYEATREQALRALAAYPGGMQLGGGVTPENGPDYIAAGASHVIVTSYVFQDGMIHFDRLQEMVQAVGRAHLVLDLSCRKMADGYFVVTDRWQKMTRERVDAQLMDRLAPFCDEFLIHAVDVEGKSRGIETELVTLLGAWQSDARVPITYAGGVHNMDDLQLLQQAGGGRIHVTIGSALDLFGGDMHWEDVARFCREP